MQKRHDILGEEKNPSFPGNVITVSLSCCYCVMVAQLVSTSWLAEAFSV